MEQNTAASAHILLVDDEEVIRALGRAVLGGAGHTVITEENGRDGIAFFEAYGDTVDLVIADLNMPRCGGLEMLKEIRRMRPGVKALVLTGGLAADAGAEHVLVKPFSIDALLKAVYKCLQD